MYIKPKNSDLCYNSVLRLIRISTDLRKELALQSGSFTHLFFCSMCIILCELVVEEKGKNVLKCSATSGRLETDTHLWLEKDIFPLFSFFSTV